MTSSSSLITKLEGRIPIKPPPLLTLTTTLEVSPNHPQTDNSLERLTKLIEEEETHRAESERVSMQSNTVFRVYYLLP